MKIAILGGAGYVGSVLAPHLYSHGHDVTVLDTFWFGDHLSDNIKKIKGDIRNRADLRRAIKDQDAVIHLACVSNDPSFDMNPELGKSINYSCFKDCLTVLQEQNIKRFIYASSSSVYGVSKLNDVREESPKDPLTDYSRYKLACETELQNYGMGGVWTILRPATVCGFSPRLRLDLVVNILTIQAACNGRITLLGKFQKRPNINVMDMVLAYEHILNHDERYVDRQIFNVGDENLTLTQIAHMVRGWAGEKVVIDQKEVVDPRSYHINSDKIKELGFKREHSIASAIKDIIEKAPGLKDPMSNPIYYNIKQMKELGLI